MLKFTTNVPQHEKELLDEVNLFFPSLQSLSLDIDHAVYLNGNALVCVTDLDGYRSEHNFKLEISVGDKFIARLIKHALYLSLKEFTHKSPPWGSLTGIRPTKLAYEFLGNGGNLDNVSQYLSSTYDVDCDKSELIARIIKAQQICERTYPKNIVNLYVHIPFCTSRCNYCSFVSLPMDKQKHLVEPYIDKLIEEIRFTANFLDANDYQVYSVYIGGGTPTALSDEQFFRVLDAIPDYGVEYTVEAGRPDSITRKKLDTMLQHGVSRISINPQSFRDDTLQHIGRNHSVQQIYDVFNLAREYPFDINMDLIAGLADETIDDFVFSIKSAVDLTPENITIHTLSRKNGAKLKEYNVEDNSDITPMLCYAERSLAEAGYIPYYLYRQKRMMGNLENVGYCLPQKQCVNNITTMEETLGVVACGSGAISKRLYENNRIERFANIKDVKLYNEKFYELLSKKEKFFCN